MEGNKKPHIVIFTGSGISAESGIPTFRDSDGLWNNYDINTVCTHKAWEANPEFLIKFYNELRKQVIEKQPNAAHYAITRLQVAFPDTEIITQNVDDLHERAGSKNILHIHGEINKLRSSINPKSSLADFTDEYKWGDKHADGSLLRPHIVFFGEDVVNMPDAHKMAMNADIFIVIGTSLMVYPAAHILESVSWQSELYIIDPNEIEACSNSYIKYINKPATEGVPEVVDMLINKYQ